MAKTKTAESRNARGAWRMVLASLVVTAAGIGMYNSTNSVFVKPVCDELGFSRGEFTLHRTIITLTGAFLMPLYGRIVTKHGVKKVMAVCSVMVGLAMIGYSFATRLWQFYAVAFVNGAFMNGVNFIVVGTLINKWFKDRKGLATGLAFSGSGLGAAAAMPLAGLLVTRAGWRWTYRGVGVLGILILLPVILFLIKETPESIGLTPYESKKGREKAKASLAPVPRELHGVTLRQAFSMPQFYMLGIAFLLVAMLAGGPNTHTVPYLQDIGYSTAYAASVFSLIMAMLAVGKVLLGMVFDRFGTLAGSVFLLTCCLLSPLLALMAQYPGLPWIFAAVYGLASTGVSVPLPVLLSRHFGDRDFPAIFSFFSMLTTLGTALAVPLMGAIRDMSGTYRPAWTALAVLAGVIALGLLGAEALGKKADAAQG